MIPLNFQTLWLNIYPFNNEFIFLHLYISLLYAVVEEFFDTNFSKKSQIERRKLFDLRLLAYMEYLFIINDIFN